MKSTIKTLMAAILCFSLLSACVNFITPSEQDRYYTQSEVDYFLEIAFGSEYGSRKKGIIKWVHGINMAIKGSPTWEDTKTLFSVIDEINEIVGRELITIGGDKTNFEIHFMPLEVFEEIEPNYVPENDGFFWLKWNGGGEIYSARVLISSDRISQKTRSHLIREEVTQALGLSSDSWKYEDSIFYQGWSETTSYSELDRKMIEMLYLKKVHPNMNQWHIRNTLLKK